MADRGLVHLDWMSALCACAVWGMSTAPVAAQKVVGKALVEGKSVLLFDDRTWSFENATPDCQTLTAKLNFCGATLGWTPSTRPTPDVLAAFRLDSKTYANFIYEDLGTANGLTVEGVRDILLQIVQGQTGSIPTVVETSSAKVGSLSAETLVYAFKISGLDVVYANTFVLGTNSLLQAQTYELTTNYSDKHRQVHADFLTAIQYSGD